LLAPWKQGSVCLITPLRLRDGEDRRERARLLEIERGASGQRPDCSEPLKPQRRRRAQSAALPAPGVPSGPQQSPSPPGSDVFVALAVAQVIVPRGRQGLPVETALPRVLDLLGRRVALLGTALNFAAALAGLIAVGTKRRRSDLRPNCPMKARPSTRAARCVHQGDRPVE
jgi:hypothetical protein